MYDLSHSCNNCCYDLHFRRSFISVVFSVVSYTHIINRNLARNAVDDGPEHIFFNSMVQQLLVGQGLILIEASRSPSVGHTTLGTTLLSYGTGSLPGIKRWGGSGVDHPPPI
jgi:hypothetical protein